MSLQAIINTAADEADEFLAGISSMTEARAAIREYLKENHPDLNPTDNVRVVAGILAILDDEGFFETAVGGDPFEPNPEGDIT